MMGESLGVRQDARLTGLGIPEGLNDGVKIPPPPLTAKRLDVIYTLSLISGAKIGFGIFGMVLDYVVWLNIVCFWHDKLKMVYLFVYDKLMLKNGYYGKEFRKSVEADK